MLKDDFFTIVNQTGIDNHNVHFAIRLDENHIIYRAHFPNNPITPGVCIVQIAKELFSAYNEDDFVVTKVRNVKFSHPIIPTVHSQIDFNMKIEETEDVNIYTVKSTVCAENIVFTKLNMTFKRAEL